MTTKEFTEHNARSKEIWSAYEAGEAIRVPVTIGAGIRNWIAEPSENTRGLCMAEYVQDPRLMLEGQVRTSEWVRHNILSDDGMGYPEDGWSVMVDFQNYAEAAWFGAPVVYHNEPTTVPFLTEEDMESFIEKPLPSIENRFGREILDCHKFFLETKQDYRYAGLPIAKVDLPFNMVGTDGPFTVACQLCGAETMMIAMLTDPELAGAFLSYVTEATVSRIKNYREYLGMPEQTAGFFFADDSIVMLSEQMFREFVLPCHRKLYETFSSDPGQRGMHLCGDAQRFYPILQREFGILHFDTGFPMDFSRVNTELDPHTRVNGGPHIGLLLNGTAEEVFERSSEILQCGVMKNSRKFVLREGNSLAPGTPLENVNAIYRACERFGRY